MAFTNYSRARKYNQKREAVQFVAELIVGTAADAMNGVIPGTSYNELLGKLPPNSLITNAYVFVRTASNAATSAAFTLGTADGGAQLLTGVNAKTLGKQGTFVGFLDTGTGVSIYLNRTITGAETTGRYIVVVEYLEYNKVTGELTDIV